MKLRKKELKQKRINKTESRASAHEVDFPAQHAVSTSESYFPPTVDTPPSSFLIFPLILLTSPVHPVRFSYLEAKLASIKSPRLF